MSHEHNPGNTLEQALTPADMLGVVDGEFDVHRDQGRGPIEQGWSVYSANSIVKRQDGTEVPAVIIVKPDPENAERYLQKRVPFTEFMRWQADKAEIEKPEEILRTDAAVGMGSVALQQALESPEAENPREARYKQLFAPVVTEAKPESVATYDHLFLPEEEYEAYRKQMTVENAAIRDKRNSREYITDDNREAAAKILEQAVRFNPQMSIILRELSPAQNGVSLDVVDTIRTNPELRVALGKYFLDKVNANAYKLPNRVLDNLEKKAEHLGYDMKMFSREYVALLCLSMLDGSFDYESETSSKVQIRDDGEVVLGQHRSAARDMLLGY